MNDKLNEFYKILKDRQKKYDDNISELMDCTPSIHITNKIANLMIHNGELTQIIWKLEDIINEIK